MPRSRCESFWHTSRMLHLPMAVTVMKAPPRILPVVVMAIALPTILQLQPQSLTASMGINTIVNCVPILGMLFVAMVVPACIITSVFHPDPHGNRSIKMTTRGTVPNVFPYNNIIKQPRVVVQKGPTRFYLPIRQHRLLIQIQPAKSATSKLSASPKQYPSQVLLLPRPRQVLLLQPTATV